MSANTHSEYENFIWKACGKHTMHSHCLRNRLIWHEIPFYGPCECNGSYPLWKTFMPDDQKRTDKTKIRYVGFGCYEMARE